MTRFTQLFTALCCAFIFGTVGAQEITLSGNVSEPNGTPIPFANVILLTPDEVVVLGGITGENGSYSLENLSAADYKLKASFVGYEEYLSEVFTLSGNKTMPTIVLSEGSETLDEVTIVGKKPTVSRKADRLVFNVENSIVTNGSTWDILKSTPGVVIKQDALMVRNEGVTVYLNDKKVELNGEEIQNLLESIGGDSIKAVEVIMNPPAKYDAEGGPVLNIISSKAKFEGYKGTFAARGTYGIFPKHYFGTSHYFKTKKINLFFNYGYSPLKKTQQSDNFINYSDGTGSLARWVQDYERKTWSQAHNANLIVDYQMTEKQQLSMSAVGLYSPDVYNFARSQTDVSSLVNNPFTINTSSGIDSNQSNLALDLKYTYTLEKGSFSTNIHYTTYSRDLLQSLSSRYTDENNDNFRNVSFTSDAIQDIEIYTGQIDYETQIGKVAFEAGGKAAIIDSQSKIDFLSIQNDAVNGLDQAQNDDFLYDENVYAGYFSMARDWDKWSLKGGLRAEQTRSVGTSLVLNEEVNLDYLEWFPSAYVQYAASDKHSFSLDYGRKLYRPRYQDLNPFAYFLNENNYTTGNSGLLPAFSHRFNFNYSLQGKYFFDLYYRDNGENILTLPFQDNVNQVLRTERQNALDSKSWGLDFTHGRSIKKWWYFYTYISLFHEEETFLASESNNAIVTNEVEGIYLSGYNYLTLSKDKTWKAEASIEYFSQFISGSYKQEATTNLTLALKKSFWKNRATLTITGNDLLGEANALLTSRYLNQDNSYFAIPETQNVRIGFTYNFGNFKLEDNNRSINKEERDRLETKD